MALASAASVQNVVVICGSALWTSTTFRSLWSGQLKIVVDFMEYLREGETLSKLLNSKRAFKWSPCLFFVSDSRVSIRSCWSCFAARNVSEDGTLDVTDASEDTRPVEAAEGKTSQ